MKRALPSLAVIIAAIAATAALVVTKPEPEPELRENPPSRITVTRALRTDLRPTTRLTGRLHPARDAMLRFEVSGRVAERLVEPGHRVAMGTPLARMVDADYRDALSDAEARLSEEQHTWDRDRRLLELAVEQLALQRREVKRLSQLGEHSLASRTALDEARQRLLQLRAEQTRLDHAAATGEARLTLARTAVERARRNLARTTLTAPFTATVNRIEFEVGDYLTSGREALELVETERLDLYLEVGNDVARVVSPGDAVPVTLDQHAMEKVVEGEVIALQRNPDPRTHTHPLRIRIDGDGLSPGRLARAELPLAPLDGVITVPVAALLREQGRAYLFVVGESGRLERREVTLGPRHEELQVVISGVEERAPIAARDVASLSDGQVVVAVKKRVAAPPPRTLQP